MTAHEFGHTLGYVYSRGDGEEYNRGHPFFNDLPSIMNVGRTVRPRHLRLILCRVVEADREGRRPALRNRVA